MKRLEFQEEVLRRLAALGTDVRTMAMRPVELQKVTLHIGPQPDGSPAYLVFPIEPGAPEKLIDLTKYGFEIRRQP